MAVPLLGLYAQLAACGLRWRGLDPLPTHVNGRGTMPTADTAHTAALEPAGEDQCQLRAAGCRRGGNRKPVGAGRGALRIQDSSMCECVCVCVSFSVGRNLFRKGTLLQAQGPFPPGTSRRFLFLSSALPRTGFPVALTVMSIPG